VQPHLLHLLEGAEGGGPCHHCPRHCQPRPLRLLPSPRGKVISSIRAVFGQQVRDGLFADFFTPRSLADFCTFIVPVFFWRNSELRYELQTELCELFLGLMLPNLQIFDFLFVLIKFIYGALMLLVPMCQKEQEGKIIFEDVAFYHTDNICLKYFFFVIRLKKLAKVFLIIQNREEGEEEEYSIITDLFAPLTNS
jgi:hypothetical protein